MSAKHIFQIGGVGRLYSVLIGQPQPVVLLGAGASLRSGVPLASTITERAARWAFAKEHGRSPDDPRLLRSDWFPWLTGQSWYRGQESASENYPAAVHNLLQPRQARADFFRGLLNTGLRPSPGYEKLAEFLHLGLVKTVLTTNFDALLIEASVLLRRPHHIDTIQTDADYTKFSTSPRHPQLVYLHGSVDHYTDKNILDEVQQLDPKLVDMIVPLLRDHPLVVVGYRGGEASIMRHLLLQNAENTHNFRQGIFWCRLKGEELPTAVVDLARSIGTNFTVIDIDGFDELFERDLWQLHQDAESPPAVGAAGVAPTPPTRDMSQLKVLGLNELDWATLQARIVQYCEALEIKVPADPDRSWIIDRLVQTNLADRVSDGSVRLTMAGGLLFGQSPQSEIPSARVTVRARGSAQWMTKALGPKEGEAVEDELVEVERIIEGNLWAQYDGVNDILGAFNRPFRLKGGHSETVLPFPPLALKEVVVNALVHRDYGVAKHVLIEIEQGKIRILNPGGLIDEVQRRVEAGSIEDEIRKGRRGIKGYRNPVLADLFYGSGEMDKKGSGLSDVYQIVRANGGDVRFGPTQENTDFEVVISSRPEVVDEETGTAVPAVLTSSTYAANVLEVQNLPDTICHAGTEVGYVGGVWKALPDRWIPPFLLFENRFYSFYSLDDQSNPLSTLVDSDMELLSLSEFASGIDGERRLVWLLNLSLQRHLYRRGMIIDGKRKRAYFPRTEVGPRTITYQARLRKATRTVVKPRLSPRTNQPIYWEHESLGWRFEKFGETWGLLLEPGYVFTFDGEKGLLAPEKVNRLSTRRAARDYNNAVLNDLAFWAWLVSGGARTSFSLNTGPLELTAEDEEEEADDRWTEVMEARSKRALEFQSTSDSATNIVLSAKLPTITVNDIDLAPDEPAPDDDDEELEELDEELVELAEEHRQEAESEGGFSETEKE